MVTIGKEKGYGDALRVEEVISKGIVKVVEVNVSRKSIELAKYVDIHKVEMKVIFYALKMVR